MKKPPVGGEGTSWQEKRSTILAIEVVQAQHQQL